MEAVQFESPPLKIDLVIRPLHRETTSEDTVVMLLATRRRYGELIVSYVSLLVPSLTVRKKINYFSKSLVYLLRINYNNIEAN